MRAEGLVRVNLLIMTVLLACSQGQAATTLNFPRVSFDPNTLTGVAFVNPTDQTATVQVVAYGEDGKPVTGDAFANPAELTIAPYRQEARLLSEIFSGSFPSDQVAWMEATSSVDGITGFFLYLDPSLSFFDGADLPETQRKIVFNEVRSDDSSSTELNVFNPNPSPTILTLTLFRPNLAPLTLNNPINLAAHGVTRFDAGSVFGLDSIPVGSTLTVVASAPVGGFEFVRFPGQDLVGLNAKPGTESLSALYFPQLAVLGPWKTELGVVSYAEQPSILTISAYRGDGSLYAEPDLIGSNPVTRILPAGQTMLEDISTLFQFPGTETLTGWLKVESTSDAVNGFMSYGIPIAGSRAAVAAQGIPRKIALFSHIATAFGYFTGVALLNPGTIPTNYRVIAFTKEGAQIGTYEGLLRPGERVSQLITEMIEGTAAQSSGFFIVVAEQPIYMSSLFGTSTVLANIAPQSSSALDGNTIGGQSSTVTPHLAVVRPGASFQFQASAFTIDPVWKVESLPGGDPEIGNISQSGLFTAPSAAPDLLPVTVSAESENQVSGAAADILDPSVLLRGQGTVLSVAYLRNLKRLYTAELSAQAIQATSSGQSPAADPPTSRIVRVFPGAAVQRAEFQGERISKMIPYTASNGTEFLLFTANSSGRVIRLNPDTGEIRDVITGLNAPSALVLDPVGGNLLVAEQNQIRSFPRPLLEGDLPAQSQTDIAAQRSSTRRPVAGSAQVVSGLVSPQGLVVDACSGRLYFSDAGSVVEFDRLTGQSRILVNDLEAPGQLLAIYRSGQSCPSAFHLLVSNPGGESPILVVPSEDLVLPWVGLPDTADLAFVPKDSSLGTAESVLLGEVDGSSGQVERVRVSGLYSDHPTNPSGAIPALDFADPLGDTFGSGTYQPDAWSVTTFFSEPSTTQNNAALVFMQGDSTSNGNEIVSGLKLTFRNHVSPAGSGQEDDLFGWIDLDTDQDPLTGRTSYVDERTNYSAGIGSDFILDFGGFSSGDGTIPLLQVVGESLEEVARIRVAFVDEPDFGGTSVLLDFHIDDIDPDGRANVAILVGTAEESTDAIPNGGYLSSGYSAP